jgi:hypothetical protein
MGYIVKRDNDECLKELEFIIDEMNVAFSAKCNRNINLEGNVIILTDNMMKDEHNDYEIISTEHVIAIRKNNYLRYLGTGYINKVIKNTIMKLANITKKEIGLNTITHYTEFVTQNDPVTDKIDKLFNFYDEVSFLRYHNGNIYSSMTISPMESD